jgi:prepilin-type processing-associated H-X9-DG protein
MFAGDNQGQFPVHVSTNSGGSMEWLGTKDVYRHFLSVSNELGSPIVLIFQQDTNHTVATNFTALGNQNLSYWIEQDAKETYPTTLLAGDRNLSVNGIPLNNGCYQIATQQAVSWNNMPHKQAGNVAMTDGSVRQTTSKSLHQIRAQQQLATNWLAIP